jgi:hypothetical protein
MQIEKDSSENKYIEVDMDNGEKVRVTHITKSWSGQGGVRIQIRDEGGHLRQGPEISAAKIGDVVAGIINLVK